MFYSDKETEESEKKFQENLNRVRKLASENQERQGALVYELMEECNKLKEIKDPSAEVLAKLKEALVKIEEISKILNENIEVLEESLTRRSSFIYYEIKRKAESGDPEAMKAYLDLKPDYEMILLSKTSAN